MYRLLDQSFQWDMFYLIKNIETHYFCMKVLSDTLLYPNIKLISPSLPQHGHMVIKSRDGVTKHSQDHKAVTGSQSSHKVTKQLKGHKNLFQTGPQSEPIS